MRTLNTKVFKIKAFVISIVLICSTTMADDKVHKESALGRASTSNESFTQKTPSTKLKKEGSIFELVFGSFEQGGMIYAKTQAGNKIEVLGRSVYVDEAGYFVFGLGRDAKPEVTIKITENSGRVVQLTRSVKQREYKVQKIEGVAKKYVSPPDDVLKRIRKENSAIGKARAVKTTENHFAAGFHWPAEGPITGVYGSQRIFNGVPKRPHFGLDIAGPVGTPVIAPAAGTVTLAEDDLYYSGGTLIMDHGQGISSTFIHLSKVLVKVGDKVNVGQNIGEIGATGRVTGPHLDWRINWFKQRLDPQLLLPSVDPL